MEGVWYPCSICTVSCGHGLCHHECIDLHGCSQAVWHRPFLSWALTEWATVHEKDHIVCMQRRFLWGSVGLLSGYADIFLNLLYSYSIYTLFYCIQWEFSDNSSLLNPTEYCSNLKVCLNKICILRTVSYRVYQLSEISRTHRASI